MTSYKMDYKLDMDSDPYNDDRSSTRYRSFERKSNTRHNYDGSPSKKHRFDRSPSRERRYDRSPSQERGYDRSQYPQSSYKRNSSPKYGSSSLNMPLSHDGNTNQQQYFEANTKPQFKYDVNPIPKNGVDINATLKTDYLNPQPQQVMNPWTNTTVLNADSQNRSVESEKLALAQNLICTMLSNQNPMLNMNPMNSQMKSVFMNKKQGVNANFEEPMKPRQIFRACKSLGLFIDKETKDKLFERVNEKMPETKEHLTLRRFLTNKIKKAQFHNKSNIGINNKVPFKKFENISFHFKSKPTNAASKNIGTSKAAKAKPKVIDSKQTDIKSVETVEEPDNFKTANPELNMAITLSDFPRLLVTEDQFKSVSVTLNSMIDELETDPFPRFEVFRWSSLGFIEISCKDVSTRDWVRTAVVRLQPIDGWKLLEGPSLPRYVKVMAYVDGAPIEADVLLRLLEKQNEIDTCLWTVTESQNLKSKGTGYILGVDEDSLKTLANLDFEAYAGVSTVKFEVSNP